METATFTIEDIRKALQAAVEAGYINEYGAHRIVDLLMKQK